MRDSTSRPDKPYHHGDLHNALLEAGLEILDREGIAAVTLRAIAARAGVSHAAPAHHFGNLKGLMTALAAIAFDRLHASIQEAIDAAPKDPVEQMRASGRGYVRFAETNPGLFRLMFNSSLLEASNPDLQHAGQRAYMQLCGIAAPAAKLRGGTSEEDVRAVALQIWCTAHGFAHLLLEQQITAPPGGQPRASRLPDIAGLLLRDDKPPRKTKSKRR
jgi:AcrR family transcriptional regulator